MAILPSYARVRKKKIKNSCPKTQWLKRYRIHLCKSIHSRYTSEHIRFYEYTNIIVYVTYAIQYGRRTFRPYRANNLGSSVCNAVLFGNHTQIVVIRTYCTRLVCSNGAREMHLGPGVRGTILDRTRYVYRVDRVNRVSTIASAVTTPLSFEMHVRCSAVL